MAPQLRTALRPALIATLALVPALALSGCSSLRDDERGADALATRSGSGGAVSTTAAPTDVEVVQGTALRFSLPRDPRFELDSTTVGRQGSLERRWRSRPEPGGGFCVVITAEQRAFSGQFPESTLELFAAGSLPDQETVRNAALSPAPLGTVGGVQQEATYALRLEDGRQVRGRIFQRKYLTPGRTLIGISVGGPDAYAARCRMAETADSLAATGREFQGATPSATPAAGSAGPGVAERL